MNHSTLNTPRSGLLTALCAIALIAVVPPAAIAQTKKPELPPQKSATALKSITTTEGKTYDAVEITKVNPDSISFIHSAGVATVAFAKLPPDVQRRFNYVPKPAAPSASASTKPEVAASGIPGLQPPSGKSDAPAATAGQSGSTTQNPEPKPNPAKKYKRVFFTKTEEREAMERCKPVFEKLTAELGVEYKVSGRDAAIIVRVAKIMARRLGTISEDQLIRTYAHHGIVFATSEMGKQLQVVAAIMSRMLDSQLASIKVQGGSSGLDFIRNDGMAALVARGDPADMEWFLMFVTRGGLGENFSVSNWLQRSKFLTADDARSAAEVADFVAAGRLVTEHRLRWTIAKMLEDAMSPVELTAINQAGGMTKLVDGLNNSDFDDPRKILADLKAMGLQMNSSTLELLAGKISQSLGAIRSKLEQPR
jgi:hypothetical protein